MAESGGEDMRTALLPEQDKAKKKSSWQSWITLGAVVAVLVFFIGGGVAVFRSVKHEAQKAAVPYSRKSPALTLFTAGLSTSASNRNASGYPKVGLWSGKGRKDLMYPDYYEFDFHTGLWEKIKKVQCVNSASLPRPRWKAAVAESWKRNAMIVHGGDPMGDYPTPSTEYLDDTWVLRFKDKWSWTKLDVKTDPDYGMPVARRAHTAITYNNADGDEVLVIFAGRTISDGYLNDVWEIDLDAAKPRWKKLWPVAASLGEEDDEAEQDASDVLLADAAIKKKKLYGPLKRKGHVAAVWETEGHCIMVIHGGRKGDTYLDDIWAFNLTSLTWTDWTPAPGIAPMARDHHMGVKYGDRLFIYGGRSGDTHDSSIPLGDLWDFDFDALQWRNLTVDGPQPHKRFLHSLAEYKEPGWVGTKHQKVVVFGGQGDSGCYFNDLWEFNVDKLAWTELHPNKFIQKRCRKKFGEGNANALLAGEALAGNLTLGEGQQEDWEEEDDNDVDFQDEGEGEYLGYDDDVGEGHGDGSVARVVDLWSNFVAGVLKAWTL